jgi:hypothetical protein
LETTAGQKNVAHPALVGMTKIHLPPLHIKLGLIKLSMKTMDKENEGFACLRQKFPKIRESKLKQEIKIADSQITQLFEERDFNSTAVSA